MIISSATVTSSEQKPVEYNALQTVKQDDIDVGNAITINNLV